MSAPKRKKVRADQLVHARGLAESRSKAAALILAGEVVAGEHRVEKPGQLVDEEIELRIKGATPGSEQAAALKYVSRGALKLEKALDAFGFSPAGKVCVDLGASTGGFTDLMLQRGALRVHAVDVGYGQLHEKLRQDPRVISHERVNARALTREQLGEAARLAVADLSFISLKLVLPALAGLLDGPGAEVAVLVKPQFEAGRAEVGKGGVVRNPEVHRRVVVEISAELERLRFQIVGAEESPLKGPAGNKEFLLGARLLP